MRRYIINIVFFIAIIIGIDVVIGSAMNYIVRNSQSGFLYNQNYSMQNCKEDVLIFGSSRGQRHYNPKIIYDSLSMTCYNCASNGNGILLAYGRLCMITSRYTPKIVVYDWLPSFDLYITDDNEKYLDGLKQFAWNDSIRAIMDDVNVMYKYKCLSNMYCYNSRYISAYKDYRSHHKDLNRGFMPLENVMPVPDNSNEAEGWPEARIDTLKQRYIHKFINLCKKKNIQLVFSISPWWGGQPENAYDYVRNLCRQYHLSLIDQNKSEELIYEASYWSDRVHLNSTGADVFSAQFSHQLKSLIENQ